MYGLMDGKEKLEKQSSFFKFKSILFTPTSIFKLESHEITKELCYSLLERIEKIMVYRIKIYVGVETSTLDFQNTKTEDNEKQIQQQFMEADNECLFHHEVIPFEMEYNIYAGTEKEESTDREKMCFLRSLRDRSDQHCCKLLC